MEHKKPQIPILLFLISMANVLGVLYSAALPALEAYFQVSKAQAQETVSLYLVGCLLGQIVYAPIANALGRKPAIYLGGFLAVLGSLLCLFAIQMGSFKLLLLGRGLTAFGASCGLVLTNTLIADAYPFAEGKKILSYLVSGFAIFPAIGITVGGFITEYFSWVGCFYFMLVYSLFVIGLCTLLPETAKERHLGHLHILRIAKSYFKQVRNVPFLLHAAIVSCASIILYVFSAEAPFIAFSQLHISADQFGLYNLIPNIGLFFGGIASARLSHKMDSRTFLWIGSSIFLALSITMWLFFELSWIHVLTLFGMPLLIFFAAPTIISNGQALSLAASEDKAYASSLMYMIQYGWMFLSITALSFFSSDNASALPAIYTCSGILMIVFLILVRLFPMKRL